MKLDFASCGSQEPTGTPKALFSDITMTRSYTSAVAYLFQMSILLYLLFYDLKIVSSIGRPMPSCKTGTCNHQTHQLVRCRLGGVLIRDAIGCHVSDLRASLPNHTSSCDLLVRPFNCLVVRTRFVAVFPLVPALILLCTSIKLAALVLGPDDLCDVALYKCALLGHPELSLLAQFVIRS